VLNKIFRLSLIFICTLFPTLIFLLCKFTLNKVVITISCSFHTNLWYLMVIFVLLFAILTLLIKEVDKKEIYFKIALFIGTSLVLIFPTTTSSLTNAGLFNTPIEVNGPLHLIGAIIIFASCTANIILIFSKYFKRIKITLLIIGFVMIFLEVFLAICSIFKVLVYLEFWLETLIFLSIGLVNLFIFLEERKGVSNV